MKATKMPRFRQSLRELFSRSPPRAPPTVASASPSSSKEPSNTAATSAANIAVDPPSTPSTTLAGVVQSNSTVPSPAATSSLGSVPSTPALPTNNSTPLGPSQLGSSPSSSPGRAILNDALAELGEEERKAIKEYASIGGEDPKLALDAAYKEAEKKQKEYQDKAWVWTVGKHKIQLRDVASNIVEFLDKFKEVGDVVTSIDPVHAGLPWAGFKVLLEIPLANNRLMGELLSGLEIVLYMGNRLKVYYDFLTNVPPDQARINFEAQLRKLQVKLLRFLAKAIILYAKNPFFRTWNAIWGVDGVDAFDTECNELAKQADIDANNCSRNKAAEMMTKLNDLDKIKQSVTELFTSIELTKLAFAGEARFDSGVQYDQAQCLKATRVDLLRQITDWANSSEAPCIFWLNGMPGTGKSTISRTIARLFYKTGQLGASFFFQRGPGDCGDSKQFFTTIARQLVDNFPAVTPFILEAIKGDASISKQNPNYQFEHLIKQPLSKGLGDDTTVVLVIDALDECENESKTSKVLPLLAQACEVKPARLRIFLTSRPGTAIGDEFRDNKNLHGDGYINVALEDTLNTLEDLSAYFTSEFANMERKPIKDWPGTVVIEKLARMAEPSFIFAATICRIIEDRHWTPEKQLKRVQGPQFHSQGPQLDKAYRPVMTQLGIEDDPLLKEQFCKLLETIALLADPLSAPALASLFHDDGHKNDDEEEMDLETTKLRLEALCSVLRIPASDESPVRMFHLSFREFLVDPQKRGKDWFWVDEQEAHGRIAWKCLELMSREGALKRNPCGFKEPEVARSEVDRRVIDEHLSSEVQYACGYWVYHVEKSNGHFRDVQAVLVFLQTHLLHWFEALSWMGRISEGVTMIITLRSLVDTYENSELTDFLYDAYRFLLRYRLMADSSPLQLYSSALIFAPKASIIRNTFQNCIPSWISQQPEVESGWNALQQTLEGHGGPVNSVAFSHDSKLLASASNDKTVKIWDTSTGSLQQTLEGHSDFINSVAISHDSTLLASASCDKIVKIWDTSTGSLQRTLEDHNDMIISVTFSHDSKLVASASYDETVKIWNTSTGSLQQTLKYYSDTVVSIAFSHDSKLVVSGSNNKTVKIWDTSTKSLQQTLEGHSDWISSIAFSHDSKLVASVSNDKTIKIWDTSTGSLQRTLQGHGNSVSSIAFSHDSKLLASASNDETFKIWNTSTGSLQRTLQGHGHSVNFIAFSHNSKLIASASDKAVKIWDTSIGSLQRTLKGQSNWVSSIAFSHNSKLVVSTSNDKIVKIWDASTGSLQWTLEGYGHSVIFSHDSKLLASASNDKTVEIWNTSTGSLQQTLEGHSDWISSIAFSHDSKLVASVSNDKTVKIWDMSTGSLQRTLQGHGNSASSIAFSHDSKLLASASYDKTVKIWDTSTGSCYQTVATNTYITSLSFDSIDSNLLTNVGSIKVDKTGLTTSEHPQKEKDRSDPQGLAISGSWVTWNTQNLLWLPSDFRPKSYNISPSMSIVAGGCSSGNVFIIGFSLANLIQHFGQL